MTERTANYERARLWLCNPNGRHHLLPVCPHLSAARQAGLGGRTDGKT